MKIMSNVNKAQFHAFKHLLLEKPSNVYETLGHKGNSLVLEW